MKEKLEQRLNALKAEYESGQRMLVDLESKQANLHQTLLRISGAIQVVEEILSSGTDDDGIVDESNSHKDMSLIQNDEVSHPHNEAADEAPK